LKKLTLQEALMTKNQLLGFKIILFLLGGIIVFFCFRIFGSDPLSDIDKFIWISIGLMYLVFFCPFFFSSVRIGKFSTQSPAFALVWFGVGLYILASIGIIVILKNGIINFNIARMFQAVLLFLFLVVIYLGYFASFHAGKVAAEEAGNAIYLNELKSKAGLLALKAGNLGPEYEQGNKSIKQSVDDIRYLSQVKPGIGADVEQKILSSMALLIEQCDSVIGGAHSPLLEDEAKKLQMLVKERKLLRN
jgi:hypothetical protein